jgi:DNA-binding transcriptional LysR family regulator
VGENFRLGYVPGATPGKWARIWRERNTVPLELVAVPAAGVADALRRGDVDVALARLPVDKSVFAAIPLYDELSVVVVSRDHLLAATLDDEAVTAVDLAGETRYVPLDDVLDDALGLPGLAGSGLAAPGPAVSQRPVTTADAVAWVASGVGVVVVPMSLARLHHRRDVTYRVLSDGPKSSVGLVWVAERTTELVEEFVGIVRGRTVNSSRSTASSAATRGRPGPSSRGSGTRGGASRR